MGRKRNKKRREREMRSWERRRGKEAEEVVEGKEGEGKREG